MYQNNRLRRSKTKKIAAPKGIFVAAILLVLVVLALGGLFVLKNKKDEAAAGTKNAQQTPSFDKRRFSLSDPTSPWVVVNKKRQLNPKDYAPADLRTPDMAVDGGQQVNGQTATALESLSKAAASEGVNLKLVSGYRSYDTQITIYDSEVRGFGQSQADRESARPGYSEHQTGWAADLGAANGKCEVEACFVDTTEGKWLAVNAYKYGFIIRYAEGKDLVTGYMYEPWHVRFVGVDLATEMHSKKIQTLEEFFGLPAAPEY